MIKRDEEPLKVTIKNGLLTISIGVETLAWAFEISQAFTFNKTDGGPEYIQKYLVTNPTGFAKDVVDEIERDDDAGNTELYKFLDQMCLAAVENGSIYIDEPDNMPADGRDFEERAKDWHNSPSNNNNSNKARRRPNENTET